MTVMTTPDPPHKENLPRVTILCGFLGAGKTTLIRHLLAQADGRRWAVVVNDLASLNVDAALVRRDTTANAGTGASPGEVVELGNGCVCCTGRDDLGEAIARLAAEGDYAHILVETTGVAEPRGLASLFTRRSAFGRSVADWAQLSALVTVIDVPAAARRWRGDPTATSPDATATATAAPRSVDELLLEQIEVADVIVLNKLDAATPDDLALVRAALPGLNARAELIETERGQVPAEWLLGRNRFDPAATLASATWITALNAAPTTPPAPPPARVRPASSRPSRATASAVSSGTPAAPSTAPRGAPYLRAAGPACSAPKVFSGKPSSPTKWASSPSPAARPRMSFSTTGGPR